MLIVCPQCRKERSVDDAKIPPQGVNVKCTCGHRWRIVSPGSGPAAEIERSAIEPPVINAPSIKPTPNKPPASKPAPPAPSPATCPKCGHTRLPGVRECPKCGVIYERYQAGNKDVPARRQPPANNHVNAANRKTGIKRAMAAVIVGLIGAVVVIYFYVGRDFQDSQVMLDRTASKYQVKAFRLYLEMKDLVGADKLVTRVEEGGTDEVVLSLADGFHGIPYQNRLMFAQDISRLWIEEHCHSAERCKIRLVDRNGNAVGGSREKGSGVWVQDR